MFKPVKNLTILFSSLAAVLTIYQPAHAQNAGLDVGGKYRIPPGQESQLLQYQLQNNGQALRQMRVIPACVVGYGLGCNKTGTVLEQLIQSNGGLNYQQMLMKAAGGETNYQNFANFYQNNPNLPQGPYMSIWRNYSSEILDSYKYGLGGTLSRNPVPGLGDVVKNFAWTPVPGGSPLGGFTNFKYSYGKVLLEEAAKIPNLNQQISEMNLDPAMQRFFLSNLQTGLNALQNGNDSGLKLSVLTLLSRPYSPDSENNGWYGRVDNTTGNLIGAADTLAPDLLTEEPLDGSGSEIALAEGVEIPGGVQLVPGGDGFNALPLLGLLPLMLLIALLGGGGDGGSNDSNNSSDSPTLAPISNIPDQPTTNPNNDSNNSPDFPTLVPTSNIPDQPTTNPNSVCDFVNPGGGGVPGETQGTAICETPILPPTAEAKKVVEPSTLRAMIVLTLILCLVNYKRRRYQAKISE